MYLRCVINNWRIHIVEGYQLVFNCECHGVTLNYAYGYKTRQIVTLPVSRYSENSGNAVIELNSGNAREKLKCKKMIVNFLKLNHISFIVLNNLVLICLHFFPEVHMYIQIHLY